MDKVYFSGKMTGGRPLLPGFVNKATLWIPKKAPIITDPVLEYLMCRPGRTHNGWDPLQNGFNEETLECGSERIKIYSKGESDQVILFVHGWAGASGNFEHFYDEFIELGYRVVVFDQLAHGRSSSKYTNLYLFVFALKTVLNHLHEDFELKGVVGHSMGASSLINNTIDIKCKKLLISPLIPFFDYLALNFSKLGLDTIWLEQLLKRFERRYELDINEINPIHSLHKLDHNTLIIQDKTDRQVDLADNLSCLNEDQKSRFIVTEGLGHFRLLKSKQVITPGIQFIHGKA
jgi:pimeloyl-ACP methyl ester carboxylesterase